MWLWLLLRKNGFGTQQKDPCFYLPEGGSNSGSRYREEKKIDTANSPKDYPSVTLTKDLFVTWVGIPRGL